jgi:hypothetical protein
MVIFLGLLNTVMSIKILGTVDKLVAKDGRVIQQAGDTDGVLASYYDLSGRPSLFLDGTQARLGNVGVKTASPNEALTVVGNMSASGNLTVTTLYGNGPDLYVGSSLVPTTSAFYIGDINNPVTGIYLAAATLYLASTTAGVTGLALSNVDNVLTVTSGGLRSSVIYTGGLLLSGNNIAADPLVGSTPLTIGTSGLTQVDIRVNTTIAGTLSCSNFVSQRANHCVASLSANQAMTSSDTVIEFIDKDDPNGWWNASTYRFQPTVPGYYNIMVMVNWIGVNAEVQVNNQIRKSGNTIAISQMPIPKSQTHSSFLQAITHMNGSSDYVDVSGYTGTNTSITGETGGNWTKFEAYKIS